MLFFLDLLVWTSGLAMLTIVIGGILMLLALAIHDLHEHNNPHQDHNPTPLRDQYAHTHH